MEQRSFIAELNGFVCVRMVVVQRMRGKVVAQAVKGVGTMTSALARKRK
jgi:hypothetical protein